MGKNDKRIKGEWRGKWEMGKKERARKRDTVKEKKIQLQKARHTENRWGENVPCFIDHHSALGFVRLV